MVEIFAGGATLTAMAKSCGLANSIAVDKVKKRNCRASIIQLNLLEPDHRALLDEWLSSPLCVWIHLAPVCGTASRARDIQVEPDDPVPLRSVDFPEGLPNLSESDATRVQLANLLYEYSCKVFATAAKRGVLVTLENPTRSYFWMTVWLLELVGTFPLFSSDSQMCMLGSDRPKWTCVLASFAGISQLNIKCDQKHKHAPWRKTKDSYGRYIWATATESQYPRKFCAALVMIVLQQLQLQGLTLRPAELRQISQNPLLAAQEAQIAAGRQPRAAKIPPLVPDFSSVIVCRVDSPASIPCALLSKLSKPLDVQSVSQEPLTIPAHSRLLRCTDLSSRVNGGEVQGQTNSAGLTHEAAFGLPWSIEEFIKKACSSGHPRHFCNQIPEELNIAIQKHIDWNDAQISKFRADWCKHWLKRATELEKLEAQDRATRPEHVQRATRFKRLLLTEEILKSIDYPDVEALSILRCGSTIAGDIAASPLFRSQYKPCLTTVAQLEKSAKQRNEAILKMTKSSGDESLDLAVVAETEEELRRGWTVGPLSVDQLPQGAVISRRFPLQQGQKIRMIDDYTVSGINDSCTTHSKVDLHMVDTFCAVVKRYFELCDNKGLSSELMGKTYDLTSAYRQVPIKQDHLKFSYFAIYNCRTGKPEVYQLLTLPFGATHSVYNFLRLAKMIFSVATRGLFLLTTNFYDDFILASRKGLVESAQSAMELVFMLTGWNFATEGKKKTEFDIVCKALGVEFNFSKSGQRVLEVCNTQARVEELITILDNVLKSCRLSKQDALVLRGKLGFADSFLHGRLGLLVLKQLVEHAYSRGTEIDDDLKCSLTFMRGRLTNGKPLRIDHRFLATWHVYTDACYEPSEKSGGIGASLVDDSGCVVAWFGFQLDRDACKVFGSEIKDTIIFELELVAGIFALLFWSSKMRDGLQVLFCDNDGVRHSLIKGSTDGVIPKRLLGLHLQHEAEMNLMTWYARVPTESNLSDFPSRSAEHPLLSVQKCESEAAFVYWKRFLPCVECGSTLVYRGGE